MKQSVLVFTKVVLVTEANTSGNEQLLLTAAVPAGQESIEAGYDIPRMSAALDYIHLMSYDLHGSWETKLGHHSQYNAHSSDSSNYNTKWAVGKWLDGGVPSSKLVFGMPAYGRGFKMSSSSEPGAPASGASTAGEHTGEAGFLAYFEICEKIAENGWTVVRSSTMASPYAYGDGEWVGFEDASSLRHRCGVINDMNLAGVMFWDVSSDDTGGEYCGEGNFPLISVFQTCHK